MSLMTQAWLLEKFGPRLDCSQLAEVFGEETKTVRNRASAGTYRVPTYVDGGKRWAAVEDVARVLDELRMQAA